MSTAKKQYEMTQHYLLSEKQRKEARKHGKVLQVRRWQTRCGNK